MIYKTPQVEQEYRNAPIFLQIIVETADSYIKRRFGKDLVITRVKENVPGDSGVHEDYRAVDGRNEMRDENGKMISREFTDSQADEICDYLNTLFKRNDGVVTAIHHSFNGGAWHLHIQVAELVKAYMPVKDNP